MDSGGERDPSNVLDLSRGNGPAGGVEATPTDAIMYGKEAAALATKAAGSAAPSASVPDPGAVKKRQVHPVVRRGGVSFRAAAPARQVPAVPLELQEGCAAAAKAQGVVGEPKAPLPRRPPVPASQRKDVGAPAGAQTQETVVPVAPPPRRKRPEKVVVQPMYFEQSESESEKTHSSDGAAVTGGEGVGSGGQHAARVSLGGRRRTWTEKDHAESSPDSDASDGEEDAPAARSPAGDTRSPQRGKKRGSGDNDRSRTHRVEPLRRKRARTVEDADVPTLLDTLCKRDLELEKSYKYTTLLEENAVSYKDKIEKLDKDLAKERADNLALRAQVESLETTGFGRMMSSDNKDESAVGTVPLTGANKTAVATARAKGKEATLLAQLNPLHRHIVNRSGDLTLLFCKAAVRQYEPADFIFGDLRIVHKWFPEPKSLSDAAANVKGCGSPGRGLLGKGDGGGTLVVESPMRCAFLPAMRGGFFGIYSPMGQNFQDWLNIVANLVVRRPSELVSLKDENGKPATQLSREELEHQCTSATSSAAAFWKRKTLDKTIHNQMSARKRETVDHFLRSLGYAAKRGKDRVFKDLQEARDILTRLYRMSLDPLKEETGGFQPIEVIEMARECMETKDDRLRRWRRKRFAKCCAPQVSKFMTAEQKAEMDATDGVDKFFRNATARQCYVRWAFVGRGHHRCVEVGYEGDTSILTLARLDAWMFCQCLMGLVDIVPPPGPDGKAGKKARGKKKKEDDGSDDEVDDCSGPTRNTFHNALFEIVFPAAVEGVLAEVRNIVKSVHPNELLMPFDPAMPDGLPADEFDKHESSKTPCEGPEGHGGDIHSQLWRRGTSSHLSPYDTRHYVVARPSFIREHVCFWLGYVRDAFVGVCDSGTQYVPLTRDNAILAKVEREIA